MDDFAKVLAEIKHHVPYFQCCQEIVKLQNFLQNKEHYVR